jgi:hypothetical protein
MTIQSLSVVKAKIKMGGIGRFWKLGRVIAVLLGLMAPTAMWVAQADRNPSAGVLPPNSKPYGRSYGEWGAKFGQWGLGLPIEGHPFLGCPEPVDAGQSGPVWFLAAGPAECSVTVPVGKALFFPLANADCSSLEDPPFHGDTAAEQRTCAKFWADHIVKASLFCEIDGVSIGNLASYRAVSPQFEFTAPTPWVFGAVGGQGTAVVDGYYLFVSPLSRGDHTIHFGGAFHFSIAEGDEFDADFGYDTTHNLTVR